MGWVVSDDLLRLMKMEAAAQYDVCPSDYLEGVLTAVSEVLDGERLVEGLREDDQARWAAGRSAVSRACEFYRGRIAALSWIVGESDTPPVPVLMSTNNRISGQPARAGRWASWWRRSLAR